MKKWWKRRPKFAPHLLVQCPACEGTGKVSKDVARDLGYETCQSCLGTGLRYLYKW